MAFSSTSEAGCRPLPGLPPALLRRIESYIRGSRPTDARSDRLFLSLRRGRSHSYEPLTPSGVLQLVKQAADRAGINKRVYTHLLRHSLATDMLRRGASLDEIGEVLRHKSPDTTAIYANENWATSVTGTTEQYFTREVRPRRRLSPGEAAAYYNCGSARLKQGDRAQAIADFTEAIRLDPNYASAYYNRGQARECTPTETAASSISTRVTSASSARGNRS